MDFNEGSKLEQATTTRQGDKKCNINFSKITKKEKKDKTNLHKMVKESIESAANDQRYSPISSQEYCLSSKTRKQFKINCHVLEIELQKTFDIFSYIVYSV